jgi:outer membrane protein assembly factor BamB
VASAGSWTTFRGDESHNASTADGPTSNVTLLWKAPTGAAVWSSPAVAYGRVFVGCRDGNLYCFDAAKGFKYWSYQTDGLIYYSSPAVANGYVYIGSNNGFLNCINASTGEPVWRSLLGENVAVQSSPVVADGLVYVGAWDYNLYCVNASSGAVVWKFSAQNIIDSSPAVADGIVYVGSADNNLYAVNASTGLKIWQFFTGGTVISSPCIYNGYVYVGSNNGSIYALNASSGTFQWQFATEDFVASSPAAANGRIYVGSEDAYVYCLDALTGQKIWSTKTGYWVWSSPIVADGAVFVGSEDFNVYCLDAETGHKLWVYPLGGPVDSSPAIVDGILYVGCADARVYALTSAPAPVPIPDPGVTLTWAIILFDASAVAIVAVVIAALVLQYRKTKRDKPATETSSGLKAWALAHQDALCIAAILLFSNMFYLNLNSGILWAADEQTYSQFAFHMVKTGDYLTPWAFGGPLMWIAKPPMAMWTMALSYQIFGVSNFAVRLPSAIFGSLTLVMMFFLGKKLYNRSVGLVSAFVLGSFVMFYTFARHAMTDVTLTFFMLASIYFLLLSQEHGYSRRYVVLSGLLFGCALLTKQTAAVLLVIIAALYLVITKKSIRIIFSKWFLTFVGVGVLVMVPWLIYMSTHFFWDFWNEYFIYGVFSRSVGAIEGHTGGYLYYLQHMFTTDNLLWMILLPFATAFSLYSALVKRVKADALVLNCMIVVVGVFTFAQTKLYWYVLPALPAFALAISSLLYEIYRKLFHKKSETVPFKESSSSVSLPSKESSNT